MLSLYELCGSQFSKEMLGQPSYLQAVDKEQVQLCFIFCGECSVLYLGQVVLDVIFYLMEAVERDTWFLLMSVHGKPLPHPL